MAIGLAETDPTFSVQGVLIRPTPKPRAANIEADQHGVLLRAIAGFQGQTVTRLALSVPLLLVPRPGELRKAEWSEIDLEAKIWSIPAERQKMRRPHQMPLSAKATAVPSELRLLTGSGKYLLPGRLAQMLPTFFSKLWTGRYDFRQKFA